MHMETTQSSSTTHEDPRKLSALTKCAHAGCTCTIDEGERYCSDYCAEQVNAAEQHDDDEDGDHECECGHAECTHEIVKPVLQGASVG